MIVTKNEIPKNTEHFIELDGQIFIPNYIIKLPLSDDEKLELENVDCIFSIIDSQTLTLKVVGIENYIDVDSQLLNEKSYGKYLPEYIYVFNQGVLDLDKVKSKYLK